MNDFGLKSSLKEYGLDEQYTWWWQLPLGIKVGAHFDHLYGFYSPHSYSYS